MPIPARKPLSGLVTLVLLHAPLLAFAPPRPMPQDEEEQEKLLDDAKEYLQRMSLGYHFEAYEMLAKAKAPFAIEELARRYDKPQIPREQSRYAIAQILGEHGRDEGVVDALVAWMDDASESRDAWLWRHALEIEIKERGPERAAEIARNEKDVVLRGAAIEALAAQKAEVLYELIPELLADLPKKDGERIAMIGAITTAVAKLGTKKTLVEPEWKKLALGLIALLEDEKFPRTAKLIVARHMAHELEADQVVLEANAWRALLAQRSQEEKDKKKGKAPEGEKTSEPEYVRPRFFGVEVTGERIAYLIDLSDSMAAPIPEEWKPKGGPVSGAEAAKNAKKRKKGDLPTEADIPWYNVETRLDLAREHLRISLQRLQPDQKFTVIGFGTEAEFFKGCEGMVKATKGNVKKVLKALDAVDIGQPQPSREYGTIWGDTNLHGALRLAYAVSKKGAVDEAEYVDLDTFVHGADTIFVLSDGNPSVDDYTVEDIDYGDRPVVDDSDEKKRKERDGIADKARYFGPYAHWKPLIDDVGRLNMFQECEIHVIGIGDADENALKALANVGLGSMKIFGK